jgi:hypothetical protein
MLSACDGKVKPRANTITVNASKSSDRERARASSDSELEDRRHDRHLESRIASKAAGGNGGHPPWIGFSLCALHHPLSSLYEYLLFNQPVRGAKVDHGWLQPLAGFVRADGDMDTDLETDDGLAATSSSNGEHTCHSSHFVFLPVVLAPLDLSFTALKFKLKGVCVLSSFCSVRRRRRGGAVWGEGRVGASKARTSQHSGRRSHPR